MTKTQELIEKLKVKEKAYVEYLATGKKMTKKERKDMAWNKWLLKREELFENWYKIEEPSLDQEIKLHTDCEKIYIELKDALGEPYSSKIIKESNKWTQIELF